MSYGLKAAVIYRAKVEKRLERLTLRGWRSFDGTGKDVTASEIKDLREELEQANEWIALIERDAQR